MAAVVMTILSKRRRKWRESTTKSSSMPLPKDADAGEPPQTSRTFPTSFMTKRNLTTEDMRRLERVISRIQAWYRGAKVRVMMRTVWGLSMEHTPRAVEKVLGKLIRMHRGWERFILQLLLLIFFLTMIIIQVTNAVPSGGSVNMSLMNVVNSADFAPSRDVTRSQQVIDYVQALLPVFRSAMAPETLRDFQFSDAQKEGFAQCQGSFERFCNHSFLPGESEQTLLPILTSCLDATTIENDAYIDNQNRIQYGMFLTQTRYATTPCSPHVARKNPLFNLTRHQCLDWSGAPSSTYESDLCGNETNPNTQLNCTTYYEFQFNQQFDAFVSILPVGTLGGTFGTELNDCRLETLKKLGWLDYRTKRACMFMFTFNENAQGRLAAFRDCFDFAVGGEVTYNRDILSASFPPDSGATLGFTISFVVMLAIWLLWELKDFTRTAKNSDVVRGLFTVLLLVFSVACLVLFFQANNRTENFFTSGSGNIAQFNNAAGFWSTMVEFLNNLGKWQQYYTLCAITMFIYIIRMLMVLDFHPTLAIVSGTLKVALGELLTFFFVFFIILICYAALGMLFFGQNTYSFASFSNAAVSLVFASLMTFDPISPLIFDPNIRVGAFEQGFWIWVVWFYSFVIIVSILLFNVLLSIVVGAFVEFQERRKEGNQFFGLFTTLFMSVHIWLRTLRGCCIRRGRKGPPSDPRSGSRVDPSKVAALDKYAVIAGLKALREKYQFKHANAKVLRQELAILISQEYIYERIIAQIRKLSVREKQIPDTLTMRAMHFNDESYRAHLFNMTHKILSKVNTVAPRTHSDSSIARPSHDFRDAGDGT